MQEVILGINFKFLYTAIGQIVQDCKNYKVGYELRLLGWITVAFLVIGIILYVYLQFFTEMTVRGKVWFILSIAAWGVVCISLVVLSFLDCYK